MQKRLTSFDFIRTLLAVGIICYHFSVELSDQAVIRPFNEYGVTGNWGQTINYIFFMLSGCLLYMHYHGKYSLKNYYWKRFKSIFPMFWIAFLYYYVQNILGSGKLFYFGRPWTLILSVIGMDGYLASVIPNYNILGEWFLGMIIMLYLLYPLIQKMTDDFPKETIIITTLVFLLTRNISIIHPVPSCSIISCIFSFTLGIYYEKYRIYKYRNLSWILLLTGVAFVLLPINCNENILNHMTSIALFGGLYAPGKLFTQNKTAARFWNYCGGLTYPVFLLQHILILQIIHAFNPVSISAILFFLAVTIVYVFTAAWILKKVTEAVFQTKWFQWFENRMIKE